MRSIFDLYGLLRVAVVHAHPAEVAVYERRFGMPAGSGEDPADLVIRVVPELPLAAGAAADPRPHFAAGDQFVGRAERRRRRVRLVLPLDRLDSGGPVEITSEPGLRWNPLLGGIVNLMLLARGALPLHATSWVDDDGSGVSAAGSSGAGKTGALLAALQEGHAYLSSEWVVITHGTLHNRRELVRVRDWHLRQLPELRQRVDPGSLRRLELLRVLSRLAGSVPAALRRGPLRRLVHLSHQLRRRANLDLRPETIAPRVADRAPLRRLFLLTRIEGRAARMDRLAYAEAVARLHAIVMDDYEPLLAAHAGFRAAYPGRRCAMIESLESLHRAAVERALENVDVWQLHLPSATSLDLVGHFMRRSRAA